MLLRIPVSGTKQFFGLNTWLIWPRPNESKEWVVSRRAKTPKLCARCSATLRRQMSRPTINCDEPAWGFQLYSLLEAQTEVDLINCDFGVHGRFCDDAARRFSMDIGQCNPEAKTLSFRVPWRSAAAEPFLLPTSAGANRIAAAVHSLRRP